MKECSTCGLCFDDAIRFCNEDGAELLPSLAGGRDLDGRWHLERVVGVGRQGSVYTATDLRESRPVLVKTLLPTLFLEPGTLATFLDDAARIGAFRHPGAGAVYAAGRLANGGAYTASEWLAGRSLKRALADDGRFTIERAVDLGAQLADALGAAHAAGILHRDVKPDNVMIDASGPEEHARLVDFGTARWTSGRGGSSVTETGSLVLRMPHYSSPEQVKAEELTAASDVYSLAIVLYEMLTGRVPFDAPSPMAVIVKHVTDAPEPPSRLRPDIPAALEGAVLRALAKSPADRPANGAAFAADLRRATGARTDTPRPTAVPAITPTSTVSTGPLPPAVPAAERNVPPPPEPLPMRLTIVDAGDEANISREIAGVVRDIGENGMRLETGTIATGRLNVVRDHTTAFKNRLEIVVELPAGPVHVSGFAVWYRPAPDGINWFVGVYIRDMPSADRARYNAYLKSLGARSA